MGWGWCRADEWKPVLQRKVTLMLPAMEFIGQVFLDLRFLSDAIVPLSVGAILYCNAVVSSGLLQELLCFTSLFKAGHT